MKNHTSRIFPIAGLLFGSLVFLTGHADMSAGAANTTQPAQDDSFQGAQWVMASAAARAVSKVGARAAVGDGELAKLIREQQDIEVEIVSIRKSYLEALKSGAESQNELQKQLAELELRARELSGLIRTRFPTYDEIANPKPQSISGVQSQLAEGEALLATLSTAQDVYVWVITKNAARWNRTSLSLPQMVERIAAIRRSVGGAQAVRGAESLDEDAASRPAGKRAFESKAAFEVYQALLAPFEDTLAGVDHVYAVTDGPLTSLPFSLLLTAAPKEVGDNQPPLRQVPFLVRRLAVTTLPSITSLKTVRSISAGPVNAVARFAGFGDPVFSGAETVQVAQLDASSAFRSGGADVDAIRKLAPLPGTRRELNNIAAVFGPDQSKIVLGAGASETAVKESDLKSASVIAFATHGLLAGELTGLAEPALVFTPPEKPTNQDDGLLTASEVSTLQLDAEWVILSACNTAGGDGTPGAEGLSGLAQAFLFAGARSILVSHWPVRDDAAARLTVDTLAALRDNPGMARSEALRRAMVKLMDDPIDETLAHPSAWAPFVVVGDGGKPLQ